MIRLGLPAVVIGVWVVVGVAGPWLSLDPAAIELARVLHGPDSAAWLGYDDLGREIADRLIVGARTSLLVAFWVVLISSVIGTIVGTAAAYLGGAVDRVLVHVFDVLLAFPGILLAIALAGVMGPGIDNVVIALSVVGWVGYARLARAQTFSLKTRAHVEAAVALGTGSVRIVGRHLIPLLAAPLIVEATFGVAGVIIGEASLSFLGLGVQPPAASWGSMIRDGTRYMLVAPHMVVAPGVALAAVVLAVNLLGDQLRDWLDVRSRR